GEVDLMANSNYAFMNDAEVESLIASKDVNSSLQTMKDRKIKVDGDKGNFRIGANAAKRMEADAKLFDRSPELWTVYAKYHKDEASLYSDTYSSVYSGVAFDSDLLMPELSVLSDEELIQKKFDTADRLMKDQEIFDTYKMSITEEFKQRKAKVNDYLAGYEKEDNKGQKIQVKGELDRIQERVNDLIDKFQEGGKELKGATSKYLINDFKAVNDQLNNLLKGDVFMLSDISQKKVWDMVSLVRPVLDYAKEVEDDAENFDLDDWEDYTPPKYEEFEEEFLAGLSDLKKETLEKAKEADPLLKAYLELPEYEKRVQNLEITLGKIEKTQSKRKKIKKESNAQNRQEMTKQYHEQRKIAEELSKNVSDTLKKQDYFGIYRTGYTMAQKYNKIMLLNIDSLNTDVLTKDMVQEIAQDFEFFKKLIEDDKLGNIFSMPEDLANALWEIYDSLAPVAAYAKKNSGEPDMDAILKLQKDTSIKVNRENAEDAYRGRLIFDAKDKESFAYMKAVFASEEKAYLISNVINE
ncbi:MAG: hypothetical protein J6N76_05305, partial [Lachnospiraceae bacterium]|nr:hypothetical protein [Lachnospiraceae bacterium]